jgi:autotransporter-associated beta strand protein
VLDLNDFNQTVSNLSGDVGTAVLLGTKSTTTFTLGDETPQTFAGAISGAGQVVKQGEGILTLSGNSTYTGGTNIHGGTLSIVNDANLGDTSGSVIFTGGTLEIAASLSSERQFILEASGNFSVDTAQEATFAGVISGAGDLVKAGKGTLVLSANNTYSGQTLINRGILQTQIVDAISSSQLVKLSQSGVFDLNDFSQTISNLSGDTGRVKLGSLPETTLTVGDETSQTFSGLIKGSGQVKKQGSGVLTLAGNNVYSGGTEIIEGTLQAGIVNAFSPSGVITLNESATLALNDLSQTIGNLSGAAGTVSLGVSSATTLTVGDATSQTFGGEITGAGIVAKQGSGILTLSGENAYTGGTEIEGGTLQAGAPNTIPARGVVALQENATFDYSFRNDLCHFCKIPKNK